MTCDASFLDVKHYHTPGPVIHFGILHFKNEETLLRFILRGLFYDIAGLFSSGKFFIQDGEVLA